MITLPDFITTARANCARPGKVDPDLWHSKNPDDQARAINTCHSCPLAIACRAYATAHDLPGIWGGTTRTQRRGNLTPTSTPGAPAGSHDGEWVDDDGRTRRACGTPGAYQQHRRRAEQCERCDAAQAVRTEAKRRAVIADAHAEGGTERGYYAHRRLGEAPCVPCTRAMRAAGRAREAQRAAQRTAQLVPAAA